MMLGVGVAVLLFALQANCNERTTTPRPRYTPDWTSIDSRPIPDWYDKAKIGIFMHWGLYSVPSFSSEWFWIDWKGNPSPNKEAQKKINAFMAANYKPGFSYEDFAPFFTAEFFNATHWAYMIKASGAKYFVITSKHHDGFAMWPSRYSKNWNSADTGPHKDVIGELSRAVRKVGGVRFGVYHSYYEWFNPLYLADKAANFSTTTFVDQKVVPEMQELVKKYRPDVFWSDGDGEAPSSYWKSADFLAWLYNDSPVAQTVAVNDRWGSDIMCHHGGFFTCADRYNPGVLQPRKWENAMTIDRNTWGYSRVSNLADYLSNQDLIDTLVSTVAFGGNLLMNVGPTKEGTIMALFQERLAAVGTWLHTNGEAIYESQPWDTCQNDTYTPNVWFTSKDKGNTVYATMLRWPKDGVLTLACINIGDQTKITMVGVNGALTVKENDKKLVSIGLPDKARAIGDYGWVLKMVNLESL